MEIFLVFIFLLSSKQYRGCCRKYSPKSDTEGPQNLRLFVAGSMEVGVDGRGVGGWGWGRGAVSRISGLLLFQFGTAPVNCLYSPKTCFFDCFYTSVFVGGEFCSKGSTKTNDWQKKCRVKIFVPGAKTTNCHTIEIGDYL